MVSEKVYYIKDECSNGKSLNENLNNPNALIIGWNLPETLSFGNKADVLDIAKAYRKFVLNQKDTWGMLSIQYVYALNNWNLQGKSWFDSLKEVDEAFSLSDLVIALMETSNVDIDNVFYPNKRLSGYIKKNGLNVGSNTLQNPETTGGLNYFKSKGMYNNLLHFDVNSFYPSIMLGLLASSNLNYDNLEITTVDKKPDGFKWLHNRFGVKDDGLTQAILKDGKYVVKTLKGSFNFDGANKDIYDLIKPFFEEKQVTEGIEKQVNKITLNSIYGILINQKSEIQHPQLAQTVTFLCRYILYSCIVKFKAVYAKTDSIWVPNTNLKANELNNYCNGLLKKLGIPNPNINWELENKVDKLLIKNANEYIEFVGKDFNFKGRFNADIEKYALMEAIAYGNIDVNKIFDTYKDNISLFAKNSKYNKTESNKWFNNMVLNELLGIEIKEGYRRFNYVSIHGVMSAYDNNFKFPVDPIYAKNLISFALFNWGFIDKKHKVKFDYDVLDKKPNFVPQYLNNNFGRPIQSNRDLNNIFGVNQKKWRISKVLQNVIVSNSQDWEYNGLVLGKYYYAIDIDKKEFPNNIEAIKEELLALFKPDQYVLQSTKSGGYHIIFKCFDKAIQSLNKEVLTGKFANLEFKKNAVLTYDCYKYKVLEGDIYKLKPFKNIKGLINIFGGKPIKCNNYNTVESNNSLDDTEPVINALYGMLETNNLSMKHNLCLAIGRDLKGFCTLEELEAIIKGLSDSQLKESTNWDGTIRDAYKNAKPSDSLGNLYNYCEQLGLLDYFKELEVILKPNNAKDKDKDNSCIVKGFTVDNNHIYKYSQKDGEYTLYKVGKEGQQFVDTLLSGELFNLIIYEDVNDLIPNWYSFEVKVGNGEVVKYDKLTREEIIPKLKADRLLMTDNKKNIEEFFMHLLDRKQEDIIYKRVKQNLTGGYAKFELLPKEYPNKEDFLKGWESFNELWEVLPDIHRKCLLALFIGNFKYLIIMEDNSNFRHIAKNVLEDGTAGASKTALPPIALNVFRIGGEVYSLNGDSLGANTVIALRNELNTKCGLIVTEEAEHLFKDERLEQILKNVWFPKTPKLTDTDKVGANVDDSKLNNLGSLVFVSNDPNSDSLEKESVKRRTYAFKFEEQFDIIDKLGHKITDEQLESWSFIGQAIARSLRDFPFKEQEREDAEVFKNHMFNSLAKEYGINVSSYIKTIVESVYNYKTIAYKVKKAFKKEYRSTWEQYWMGADGLQTELDFIIPNPSKSGTYYIKKKAFFDWVKELIDDNSISMKSFFDELGLDMNTKVKKIGNRSERIIPKEFTNRELIEIFS